jgi:hypothetical protein
MITIRFTAPLAGLLLGACLHAAAAATSEEGAAPEKL